MQSNKVIISRHCAFSTVSANKVRPSWFSRKACRNSILEADDGETLFIDYYDENRGPIEAHFLPQTPTPSNHKLIIANHGEEAAAFLGVLEVALSLEGNPTVYIVEDDYLHYGNCMDAVEAGLSTGASYVTLYDHADKYTSYGNLQTSLRVAGGVHWRTTPSTTNTYAFKLNTLKRDIAIHRKHSTGVSISTDHQKFLELWSAGSSLISCIPSMSTHCETEFLAPNVDWEKISKLNS